MTTPERLRRRQRIEGTVLVLVGILMLVQFHYFQGQDDAQKACLFNVIAEQNSVLTARGDIAARDSAANSQESAATRSLIVKVFAGGGQQAALEAFADAQAQWAEVDGLREEIAKDRASNPYPDFPAGTCD